MHKRIPILLLTGFLGAGKTTFLNWLLEKHPDLHISVILNEFGDIKLESQFLKQQSDEVVELANGCMCCVAKSDVPRVIEYILDHSPKTEHIIVEASGLSDPDPLMEAFQILGEQGRVRLDTIACLVDVLNFEQQRTQHGLVTSQIAEADVVILSKLQLAPAEQTEKVKTLIRQMLPSTRILEFNDNLSPELFLDVTKSLSTKDYDKQEHGHEHHHVHEAMQTFWYQSDKPLDFTKLQEIYRSLPVEIIRSKGIVHAQFDDGETEKVLIQYVGTRAEFLEEKWKFAEKKHTAILFLGTKFDEATLKQKLDECSGE
jgi:G3E family GTPase